MTAHPYNKQSIPHLGARVWTLVFFVGLGIFFAASSLHSAIGNRMALALGMVFLGLAAYFQPVLFRVPLRELLASSQAAAVGPPALRTGLSLAGVGLIWLSLGMRLAGY